MKWKIYSTMIDKQVLTTYITGNIRGSLMCEEARAPRRKPTFECDIGSLVTKIVVHEY